jgi:uncharacterized protein YjiS (DUF1127 family)
MRTALDPGFRRDDGPQVCRRPIPIPGGARGTKDFRNIKSREFLPAVTPVTESCRHGAYQRPSTPEQEKKMTTATRTATAIAARAAGLAWVIGRALVGVITKRRRLPTVETLDDRLLRDIGLSRADIADMRRHG